MTCVGWKYQRFQGVERPAQLLKPRPYYAEEIWKWRFNSENASNGFLPHYAGEIWTRNNHRSSWKFLLQNNSVEKLFSNCFPFTLKRKASDFKFLWLKERFRKALVWTEERKKKESCVLRFLLRGVVDLLEIKLAITRICMEKVAVQATVQA